MHTLTNSGAVLEVLPMPMEPGMAQDNIASSFLVQKRSTECWMQVRGLQHAWRGLRAIRGPQRELLLLQLQRFEAQRTGRQSRFAEEPAEAAAAAAGSAGGQVSSSGWGRPTT